MSFSSLTRSDDLNLAPVKIKINGKSLPLDCLGEILSFNDDPLVVTKILLLSKQVNYFISQERPQCCQFVQFSMTPSKKKFNFFSKIKSIGYCSKLLVDDISLMKDKHFSKFPNLEELEIRKSKKLTDSLFKFTPKLRKLTLESCVTFCHEGFKYIPFLTHMKLDNNNIINEKNKFDFKMFKFIPNLEKLELNGIRKSKMKNDGLKPLTKLRKLILYKSLFYDDDMHLESKKKLSTFEIRFCHNLTIKSIKKIKKLKNLVIHKCQMFYDKEAVKMELKDIVLESFEFSPFLLMLGKPSINYLREMTPQLIPQKDTQYC